MIEPKHCPFCGENRQEFIKAFFDELHYLRCENCAATGPGAATKEEAIIAWNNRAKHDPVCGEKDGKGN
jgi:Lar family restriction alleviation protein